MGKAAPRGFTISVFLPDGAPESFRVIQKSNWIGKGLACARSQYPQLRDREELQRPGVYVLYGPGDDPSRNRIYVGEGDNLRARLDQHLKEKDFWENVILFTSKDENLNKAHIRRIEARLISLAKHAKRADVENGTAPAEPPLSEEDAAFADTFADEMLLIYPVVGLDAFEQISAAASIDELLLSGPDANATGARSGDKFVVFKRSMARAATVSSIPSTYEALRQTPLERGPPRTRGCGSTAPRGLRVLFALRCCGRVSWPISQRTGRMEDERRREPQTTRDCRGRLGSPARSRGDRLATTPAESAPRARP